MDMSIRFPGINLVLDYVPRAFQIFGMELTYPYITFLLYVKAE